MKFGRNLKTLRGISGLSKEELSMILNIDMGCISRWELGEEYPDVDTLLRLSDIFDTPFDILMEGNVKVWKGVSDTDQKVILISSPHEGVEVRCSGISLYKLVQAKDGEPKFALLGVSGPSVCEKNTTLLGWYKEKADVMAEILEISKAMMVGCETYELRHNVETRERFFRIRIVE